MTSQLGAAAEAQRALILDRLVEIEREVKKGELEALVAILDNPEKTVEARRDALATRLMELYRVHESRAAFGLLFELTREPLLSRR